MTTAAIPQVHFYSYATGVSLELPVGFERFSEDEASAVYAVLDDRGEAAVGDPQLRVNVVGAFEPDATAEDRREAVRRLADGFAATPGELVSRDDRTVDEEPVTTVVVRRAEDRMLMHLTVAATEHRLLALVASAADDDLLPVFDAAVASIRFIEL